MKKLGKLAAKRRDVTANKAIRFVSPYLNFNCATYYVFFFLYIKILFQNQLNK